MLADTLDGVCASGLWEAKLGHEEFEGELHTYSPAYRDDEINEIFELSHTVVFNSTSQLNRYKYVIDQFRSSTDIGVRINPECSVTDTALYDPCAPGSRLGIRSNESDSMDWSLVDGLHFHALCEQDSFALEKVLHAVEKRFADALPKLRWLNMGGGHFLTQSGYNTAHFVDIILGFKKRHPHLDIYIEPGGATVLNAGMLVATVLDVTPGDPPNGILDISCTCHTPDVLEMPYRPAVQNEVPPKDTTHVYRHQGDHGGTGVHAIGEGGKQSYAQGGGKSRHCSKNY